jgi:CheY-like chemotaxis protein
MTLLFIDDDDEDINLYRDAIETIDRDSICLTAVTGKDGLRTLRHALPDLIFLDVNMPVMDGMTTLLTIKSHIDITEVPVYMLSTTSNKDEMDKFTRMGARGCLTKPHTFEELCDLLKKLMALHNGDS